MERCTPGRGVDCVLALVNALNAAIVELHRAGLAVSVTQGDGSLGRGERFDAQPRLIAVQFTQFNKDRT